MVPDDFREFFVAAAGAAGALVGLLFVAISVASEPVVGPTASVRQQVRAATALLTLLSPLVIALVALIPDTDVGYASATYGGLGLLFVAASVRRLHGTTGGVELRAALALVGLSVVMGLEVWGGVRLVLTPEDVGGLNVVAAAVIASLAYGITRAWELVGARQTGVGVSVRDLLGSPAASREEAPRAAPAPPPAAPGPPGRA